MRTGERAFSRRRDKTGPSYTKYTHTHNHSIWKMEWKGERMKAGRWVTRNFNGPGEGQW